VWLPSRLTKVLSTAKSTYSMSSDYRPRNMSFLDRCARSRGGTEPERFNFKSDPEHAVDGFASRGLIHGHDGPRAAVEALTGRWQQLVDETPNQDVLVVAKTNAEVRAVSAAVRGCMRERGLIVGPDVTVEASDASGNRHPLRLAKGDRIRFLSRLDALGVINGTEAHITSIKPESGDVRITAAIAGREISFRASECSDKRGRARLAHAYASTLFQAQGLTVERALVLLTSRFDRHDSYVASSRSRGATEFFLDVASLDREREQSAHNAGVENADDARLAYLATRLSRLSIKTNALDYATPKERAAIRRQEPVHEL
jgi:ATP-dependent exoDNAse (exonuclease V) alpha subunit